VAGKCGQAQHGSGQQANSPQGGSSSRRASSCGQAVSGGQASGCREQDSSSGSSCPAAPCAPQAPRHGEAPLLRCCTAHAARLPHSGVPIPHEPPLLAPYTHHHPDHARACHPLHPCAAHHCPEPAHPALCRAPASASAMGSGGWSAAAGASEPRPGLCTCPPTHPAATPAGPARQPGRRRGRGNGRGRGRGRGRAFG
jgi:hypothetical protein